MREGAGDSGDSGAKKCNSLRKVLPSIAQQVSPCAAWDSAKSSIAKHSPVLCRLGLKMDVLALLELLLLFKCQLNICGGFKAFFDENGSSFAIYLPTSVRAFFVTI